MGGALLAALDGRSVDMLTWVGGWAAYSLLLGAAGVSLGWILRQVAADLTARRAAWTAFLLRLAIGLALVWLLPAFGYADSEVSRGGYVFQDAATRDYQAQVLAGSGQPLFSAFSGDIPGDQYGGLLALSAAVYRYLSPSAHRPLLIVLLAGWMVGLGTALLWGGARRWFGEQGGAGELIPAAAAWVMAVYPEGVLLGASQMREPFAMAAISACFYGLIEVSQKQAGQKQRAGWAWLAGGLCGLFLLQPPVALATILVLSGVWTAEVLSQRRFSWRVLLLLGVTLALALGLITLLGANLPSLKGMGGVELVFTWLANNFGFQSHLTERASGMVQTMIQALGKEWTLPLVLVYGFAQPVLPGALIEPSLPLWTTINTLRAAGWYALAPFLIYGLFTAFYPQSLRAQRIWLSLASFVWILVAAANAGGDMWDNPRYRTIFLPWLALLAAWALVWALQRKDPWLWRWLAVEVIFVLFFLWWYISRYYPGFLHLSIWMTSGLTLGLAAMILLGGWLWDWRKRSK